MDKVLNLKICDINPHIVCSLCAGYFIDATTISECLHTFCRSCIVKYLQSSKYCPECNIMIHETQPLINLRSDRTMQDIVFKIVPGLHDNEEKRKEEFYRSRGSLGLSQSEVLDSQSNDVLSENGNFWTDELISLCLERWDDTTKAIASLYLPSLKKKFIRCPERASIYHIQLLLRNILQVPKHVQVNLICCGIILEDMMPLKNVLLTHWRGKPSPLVLFYQALSKEPSCLEENLAVKST